jgi:hypothetical protein
VVVDQHAALRHRDEKAELDKNQQDRDKDATDGERGAAPLSMPLTCRARAAQSTG